MTMNVDSLETSTLSLLQQAVNTKADGTKAYWLLDQSSLPQGTWLKRLVGQSNWVDVLGGTSEATFNGATPILVTASGACATPRFVEALYRAGRFANSVSLVHSALNLAALQDLMHQSAHIELPDAFEAMLRYFDTRTLPLLPQLLSAPQYAAFMHSISHWAYLDRWGQLKFMPAARPSPEKREAKRMGLVLDEKQEAQLIDDGLTDAVIDMLLTQQHPGLQALSPPEQFDVVEPLIQSARAQGLTEFLEAFAFAANALEQGGDFNQREPWLSRLKHYRAKQCSLEEVFE